MDDYHTPPPLYNLHQPGRVLTSDMIVQMWKMHWITASLAPDTVTARSVEFGSISLATFGRST